MCTYYAIPVSGLSVTVFVAYLIHFAVLIQRLEKTKQVPLTNKQMTSSLLLLLTSLKIKNTIGTNSLRQQGALTCNKIKRTKASIIGLMLQYIISRISEF